MASLKRAEGETHTLELLTEKFTSNKEPSYETAKWVAVGKNILENQVVSWNDEEWEEIDEEGTRKKGKAKNKKKASEKQDSSEKEESDPAQPTKVLYVCGVEIYYEFFSENWKIFNELTSPSYIPHSTTNFETGQTTLSYQSTTSTSQNLSYQSNSSNV